MKRLKFLSVACLAISITASNGGAVNECKNVNGKISESIVYAANDPLGRILGTVSGTMNGATTAILTSFVPRNPGAMPFSIIDVTTFDQFVTKKGDRLAGNGVAVFTPIPGGAPGDFFDSLILTVSPTLSSGEFAGYTGTILVEGEGRNLFSGPVGPGTFELTYKGTICKE
jgi:hypothetical protein